MKDEKEEAERFDEYAIGVYKQLQNRTTSVGHVPIKL